MSERPTSVVVAGGHGKVAMRLERLLAAHGVAVRGLIRKPEHADDLRAVGAEAAVVDLEAESDLTGPLSGADAVVFAAGSGPGSGEARKRTMDRDGAVKLVAAAEELGVRRFLMVSSMGADPDAPDEGFGAYQKAKGEADAVLARSALDYTILRPGRLTDEPGGGRVRAGARVGRGSISRDDVAAALLASLELPNTIGKTIELVEGETPIREALASL